MKTIAINFLKLGLVAFGGPAAHIAMMYDEFVERKKWVSAERFTELMGLTNIIPGPNSTEMAMQCGHEKGGVKGLIVAGWAFLIPATLITLMIAIFYEHVNVIQEVKYVLIGFQAVAVGLIIQATHKLSVKIIKAQLHFVIALFVMTLCFLGVHEVFSLLLGAILGLGIEYVKNKTLTVAPFLMAGSVSKTTLFLKFLKIGSILYGSGYVLVAYVEAEFVSKGLLSPQVLLDSIAVGQITPGPVLSTSTFIGYHLAGTGGAVLATLGIFLPSFIFSLLIHKWEKRLRSKKIIETALKYINVGSLGLLGYACIKLLLSNQDQQIIFYSLTALAIVLLYFVKKLPSYVIILIGGLVSLAVLKLINT